MNLFDSIAQRFSKYGIFAPFANHENSRLLIWVFSWLFSRLDFCANSNQIQTGMKLIILSLFFLPPTFPTPPLSLYTFSFHLLFTPACRNFLLFMVNRWEREATFNHTSKLICYLYIWCRSEIFLTMLRTKQQMSKKRQYVKNNIWKVVNPPNKNRYGKKCAPSNKSISSSIH